MAEARSSIFDQAKALGKPISREECDECLRDLALVVPRGRMEGADVDRMLDQYHSMLARRGVTMAMLTAAREAFAMAPAKDGKKFFPDPGQLYALCRDDATFRANKLKALRRALALIDGKTGGDAFIPPDELKNRFKKLSEMFRADRVVEGNHG